MVFHYYTNAISKASKNFAAGIFVVGLLLVGMGVIIAAVPEIVGYLVAGIFFIAGIGCAATAVKIYFSIRKADRLNQDPTQAYRKNVQIHIDDDFDL